MSDVLNNVCAIRVSMIMQRDFDSELGAVMSTLLSMFNSRVFSQDALQNCYIPSNCQVIPDISVLSQREIARNCD